MDNEPIAPQTTESLNSKEEVLQKILEHLPTEVATTVDFPSTGRFYTLDDPSKPVTIRPMTFQDEKTMVSSERGSEDPMNLILGRCVSNINLNQLMLADKIFLVLKLREISYGKDFSALITCPKCNTEDDITIDLTQLPIKEAEESLENPMEITLPVLKKTAKVKIPTVKDEIYLQNAEAVFSQLWRFVLEVDGHTNKEIITAVLEKLPIKDAHAITKVISGDMFGVQTKVKFVCRACNEATIMEMPITPDFFTGN